MSAAIELAFARSDIVDDKEQIDNGTGTTSYTPEVDPDNEPEHEDDGVEAGGGR